MDAFADPASRDAVSPFVQLLWERGTLYEAEVIAKLGVPFTDLSSLKGDAKEAATRDAHVPARARTCSASESEAVRPGDSMPNRWIKPGTP